MTCIKRKQYYFHGNVCINRIHIQWCYPQRFFGILDLVYLKVRLIDENAVYHIFFFILATMTDLLDSYNLFALIFPFASWNRECQQIIPNGHRWYGPHNETKAVNCADCIYFLEFNVVFMPNNTLKKQHFIVYHLSNQRLTNIFIHSYLIRKSYLHNGKSYFCVVAEIAFITHQHKCMFSGFALLG